MKLLSDVLFSEERQQRWIQKNYRKFPWHAQTCSVQIKVKLIGHYFEEERNSNKASQRSMNYFVDKLANWVTVTDDCTPELPRGKNNNINFDWSANDFKVKIWVETLEFMSIN